MPSHRDPLHDLILSLTPSEKRYFKLQNKSDGGTKSYLQLFDALDQLVEYDELKLRESLEGQKLLNQLHVAKNYLYKQILRALRSYHAGSDDNANPFLAFAEHIGDMSILHSKGLYTQSKKALSKAESVAEEYDDDLLRLVISAYRHDRVSELVDQKNASLERFEQRIRLLERLRFGFSLKYSLEQLYDSMALKSYSAVEDVLSTINFNELSFASKIDHCSYRCYVLVANHDHAGAAASAKEALDLFDKHPQQRDRSTEIYLSLLSNYFTCLLNENYTSAPELRDRANFDHALRSFDNVKARTAVHRTRVWATRRLAEFEWALATSNDGRLSEMLRSFDAELRQKQRLLSKLELGWFYFIISKAYFWTGHPSEALTWINRLLDDPEFKRYEEYYGHAMIYSLIVHYELRNLEYLKTAVSTVRRFFESRSLMSEFESMLLQSLKSAATSALDVQPLREHFRGIQADIAVASALRYFEFERWFEGVGSKKELAGL